MGVDSGLPDFRGDEGFWNAYPPYRNLGLSFVQLANPTWFQRDPTLAWGFYGHRLHLYRDTLPHAGFHILRRWVERVGSGFVFTSNVDGHFQKAGFDPEVLMECHGSLQHLQAVDGCSQGIWAADDITVDVDSKSFRAVEPLPTCPRSGTPARPNILMFDDWGWCPERTNQQQARFEGWLRTSARPGTVIIECGAGAAVPTVRYTCEGVMQRFGARLIRINPRESEGPQGTISIAEGALNALTAIDALL